MGTKGEFISLACAAAEADKQSVSIGVKVTGADRRTGKSWTCTRHSPGIPY